VRTTSLVLTSNQAMAAASLAHLLHEIGMSGRFWTRAEVRQALAVELTENPGTAEVTEIEGKVSGPSLITLTYRSTRDGRRARRNSLWRCSDGTWRLVFHQGTPL